MNSDSIKSMLGQITTAILAILVATGVMNADQSSGVQGAIATLFSSISAAIPAVLLIANLFASFWRHWNMKKVPEKSTALILPASAPSPPVGSTMDLAPLTGKAKVVG
jgi:hypothetical protein